MKMYSGLTTLEKANLAQQRKIAAIEDQLVADKKWSLTGEVVATGRPKDSLLEEFLEFQSAGKVLFN